MSTPSICANCLRRLPLPRNSKSAITQSRAFSSSRRNLHTPAPLYLDFLAPSWRPRHTPSYAPKVTQRFPAAPQFQKRSLSFTAPRHAQAITNPRTDDGGKEMTINISPRAAHRLQTISEKDGNPDLALRVSVESGGCHGFQYLMSLVNVSDIDSSEDTLFENEEVAKKDGSSEYKAKVVMDEPSLELLNGSSIDYTMELIGSQFKVTGIPGAKSSCGCGTSFDIAA